MIRQYVISFAGVYSMIASYVIIKKHYPTIKNKSL